MADVEVGGRASGMSPPCWPWHGFPDVLMHASESAIKYHPLTEATLDQLKKAHGADLERWWQARFAHAFDALTESEARYLARTPDADTVRDRIAAAEQA